MVRDEVRDQGSLTNPRAIFHVASMASGFLPQNWAIQQEVAMSRGIADFIREIEHQMARQHRAADVFLEI